MKNSKSIIEAEMLICFSVLCLIVSSCSTPDQVVLDEGREQLNRQEFAAAYQTFTRYLLLRPNDSDGYLCRGIAASALQKFLQAETDIEKAITLATEDRTLRWMHFKLLSRRLETLHDSLAVQMKPLYAVQSLEGAIQILMLTDLDQILRLDPDDTDARYERGKILRNRGQLQEAKHDLEVAFENSQRDPWILNERGRVLHDLGEYDRAVWQYSLGLKICDTCNWLLYNKALSLKAAGQTGDAIDVLTDLVDADSLDGEAWFMLAECHMILGHLSDARIAYARSAALGIVEARERLQDLRK
jgi:Flp pilus assembly protein TadD